LLERGRRRPKRATMARLARALGVEVAAILKKPPKKKRCKAR
jgi:hypothetical protein